MDYTNTNDFWSHDDPELYKDYSDDERTARTICAVMIRMLAIFVLLCVIGMCSSCTTTKYVPIVEYHTDTLIQTKVQYDSIYVHDSTIVEKGDSIIKIEHWHTKYVDREVRDTTYISKTDSIPVPYPVETIKEVEKPLSWWQKGLMWLGVAMVVVILIWVWRTK